MAEQHPFAQYVRILARGQSFVRDFTEEEAEAAMAMVMRGEVLPEQLGAFLMILRLKTESAAEIAGFVRAVRGAMERPASLPKVDLDWSSYAGKRRQLPWYLLAVLALADSGVRIFMHGAEGHTAGRVYTRDTLRLLGLPVAGSLSEAAGMIEEGGFAYVSLDDMSPTLQRIMDMRPIFGLRSPVHTLARMINPFEAPYQMQGVFHPGYEPIHVGAAILLGQPHAAVFRGEGGEIERRPNKALRCSVVHEGVETTMDWPAMLPEPRQPHDEEMDVARMARVWRGEEEDEYAEAAIVGTLAITLDMMGRAEGTEAATKLAEEIWRARDRARIGAAIAA